MMNQLKTLHLTIASPGDLYSWVGFPGQRGEHDPKGGGRVETWHDTAKADDGHHGAGSLITLTGRVSGQPD